MSPGKDEGGPREEAATTPTTDTASIPQSAGNGLTRAWDTASEWDRSGLNRVIAALARTGRAFTVDDIRDMGAGVDHTCRWGASLAAAQRSKVIESVAAIETVDGRLVRVWRGVA